jgi:replicative DNA helicase
LIIIDYLQRASPIANNQTDNRYAIDQFIGELRDLSIEIDSPILVISAQNRHGVGSGILQSFKESSGIEYGADVCMFLCEDSQRMVEPPARPLSLVIAKNRFGDIGRISLTFHPQIARFNEK